MVVSAVRHSSHEAAVRIAPPSRNTMELRDQNVLKTTLTFLLEKPHYLRMREHHVGLALEAFEIAAPKAIAFLAGSQKVARASFGQLQVSFRHRPRLVDPFVDRRQHRGKRLEPREPRIVDQ